MINAKTKEVIGRAEIIEFSDLETTKVHARIDSGARTSAIWGNGHIENGKLVVFFFGDKSKLYYFEDFRQQAVASSNGHIENRYAIKLLVVVLGRKIRATFTIANRQSQVYPVLIGRNILRGKFIVDVNLGKVLVAAEKNRITHLKSLTDKENSL
jgi:hypothetical protein